MSILYKKIPDYNWMLSNYYCKKIDIKPERTIKTKFITLNTKGMLYLKKGYAIDGASGPIFDTESIMEAVFVHDAGYQLLRLGLLDQSYKSYFDKLLKNMCLEYKIKTKGFFRPVIKNVIRIVRANYIYLGVKWFGRRFCKPCKTT